MEVDNSIKESLVANNHRFMYINGKRYYVKLCEDNFNLKEIIAKRLADILGIKCANYDIIKTDDSIYYVSEYLNILGNALSPIDQDNDKQRELNRYNLECFLQTAAKEYIEILKSMIKLVSVEVLKKVIDDIELEYDYKIPDKSIMIKRYQDNLENIKTILESRGEYESRIHKNK